VLIDITGRVQRGSPDRPANWPMPDPHRQATQKHLRAQPIRNTFRAAAQQQRYTDPSIETAVMQVHEWQQVAPRQIQMLAGEEAT